MKIDHFVEEYLKDKKIENYTVQSTNIVIFIVIWMAEFGIFLLEKAGRGGAGYTCNIYSLDYHGTHNTCLVEGYIQNYSLGMFPDI